MNRDITLCRLDPLRAARIVLACAPEIGPVSHRRILALCEQRGADVAEIILSGAQPPAWLTDALSRSAADGLSRLAESLQAIRAKLSELLSSGVKVVFDSEPDYPAALRDLGESAPCVLFYRGNASLLGMKLTAIIGTTRPSPRATDAARSIAAAACAAGSVVLSGNAAGIDRAAHFGALSSGGRSIFVPACGIACFSHHPEIRKLADSENSLVLSHAPPFAEWATAWAFMRNCSVAALAHEVVAVQCGLRGGTIFTASKAIELGRPLYACVFRPKLPECEGNAQLLNMGAAPLYITKNALRRGSAPPERPGYRQKMLFPPLR